MLHPMNIQVFGILFTLVAQELQLHFKALSANLFMSAALLAGTVMTGMQSEIH